ncbi:MAG TPA: alcohol dehydrogenase catalytic domain-containing protein [Candidatus Dormibacteraeota bacterium]|nr:alcohol dehydrogenase catalytic domain-containing protein [Candidatus Dormibacteraeota bacterium]
MKAAVIREFGPAEVLQIEDAPAPNPAAGEVLVRVRAVRVGGLLDIGTRAGRNPFARLTFPHILGADFAGDVAEVGEGVTGLSAGDRVAVSPFVACGRCPACLSGPDYGCSNAQLIGVHRPGSYAELVAVPAKVVRRIPSSLSYEQAAALALSGPVAFTQFSVAGLKADDWVLVTAAASGLGLVTALVAKALGARVIATSRKDWKRDVLGERGFEAVLDTDDDGFVNRVGELTGGLGVAIAVDNTSSATMFPKVQAAMGRLGILVCSGAQVAEPVRLDLRSLYLKSQSVIGIRTHTQAALDGFWRLAENGLKTLVDRTFPLNEVAAAHRYVEAEQNFGRVVLTL